MHNFITTCIHKLQPLAQSEEYTAWPERQNQYSVMWLDIKSILTSSTSKWKCKLLRTPSCVQLWNYTIQTKQKLSTTTLRKYWAKWN